MSHTTDIMGPGSNRKKRFVPTYQTVSEHAVAIRKLGLKIVLTQGAFDLLHIGHCRYLETAKKLGDILIVGVELDEAIQLRKGPHRPVVPFAEREEMLRHIRHVDMVVPLLDYGSEGESGLGLVKAVKPDFYVASERSFPERLDTEQWLNKIRKYAGKVIIYPSQAETSTSAKIRLLLLDLATRVKEHIDEAGIKVKKMIDEAIGGS